MANEITDAKEPSKALTLANYLQDKREDFAKLNSEIDPDKMLRVVKNAILRDPEIAKASLQSVYLEVSKAIQDGLVLDGREAVLNRFVTNRRSQQNGQWVDNWGVEVVYIPMIRGLRKLVSRSPLIAWWNADLVYQAEVEKGLFKYQKGDDPRIHHEPLIIGDRGPVVAAYSVARLRDGSILFDVMTRAELDRIRSRTKAKKKGKNGEQGEITGPWATDIDEMFKKTVARRHFKQLPLEGPAADAVERVDSLYDFERDGDVYADADPPRPVANRRKTSAAKRLAAARREDEAGDPPVDEEHDELDQGDGQEAGDQVDDAEIVPPKKGEDKGKKAAPQSAAINPGDEF